MSTTVTPRSRAKSTSFSYDYRLVREKAAVVLELGSAVFKCGFSQEHSPRHVSESTLPAFFKQTAPRANWNQWKKYAAGVLKWVRVCRLLHVSWRPCVCCSGFVGAVAIASCLCNNSNDNNNDDGGAACCSTDRCSLWRFKQSRRSDQS